MRNLSGYTLEEYKGRGVCVPVGQKASLIMEGAKVLQEQFDVPPYEARDMVEQVLAVLLPAIREDDRLQDPDKAA